MVLINARSVKKCVNLDNFIENKLKQNLFLILSNFSFYINYSLFLHLIKIKL